MSKDRQPHVYPRRTPHIRPLRLAESEPQYYDHHYFASCPVGLELLVEEELKSFGITRTRVSEGGVEFWSDQRTQVGRVMLYSRLINRLFKKLITVGFSDVAGLSAEVAKFKWPELFLAHKTFKVRTIFNRDFVRTCQDKNFRNSLFISQKIKDGIVDSYTALGGPRPSVAIENPDLLIMSYFDSKGKASLFVDLTGEPLGNRFYRMGPFQASMKENLAAGILDLMKWDCEKEVLIDGMCGSGTLVLEALMKKYRLPASGLRVQRNLQQRRDRDRGRERVSYFALEHLRMFQENGLWKKEFRLQQEEVLMRFQEGLTKMQADTNKRRPTQIYAFDSSLEAVDLTCANLGNFTGHPVVIKRGDALKLRLPGRGGDANLSEGGIIFANPPYGVRLKTVDAVVAPHPETGDDEINERLKQLYYQYGENLKQNFKGWRAFILTGNPELRKAISLQTSMRKELYNGGIECRLLQYNLF